jgi:hypothetical protein
MFLFELWVTYQRLQNPAYHDDIQSNTLKIQNIFKTFIFGFDALLFLMVIKSSIKMFQNWQEKPSRHKTLFTFTLFYFIIIVSSKLFSLKFFSDVFGDLQLQTQQFIRLEFCCCLRECYGLDLSLVVHFERGRGQAIGKKQLL